MTTFPACSVPGCTHPAQVIRRTGGSCYVIHTCVGHLYGQGFDTVEHAAAHWGMTYASNWAAAPLAGPPEGWNGSAAVSEPDAPLAGLCGLAAREATAWPAIPHAARSPMEHERDTDERRRVAEYTGQGGHQPKSGEGPRLPPPNCGSGGRKP